MIKTTKAFLFKIAPLIIVYLLFLIKFIGSSDYESFIILLVVLPLTIYIFNKNSKIEKGLKYLLYLIIIGIIFYWIFGSYGWVWSLFHGYFSFSGFSCYFTGCYGKKGWDIFIQSGLFQGDLKVLFYLGVVYLAIKNKNRISS